MDTLSKADVEEIMLKYPEIVAQLAPVFDAMKLVLQADVALGSEVAAARRILEGFQGADIRMLAGGFVFFAMKWIKTVERG